MENVESGIKKSLAVFEHVAERKKNPKKRKFRPNRPLESEDSSPSESELVIDDEKEEPPVVKRKNPVVKISDEPLTLYCAWDDCDEWFGSWQSFNTHIVGHASVEEDSEDLTCLWKNCDVVCESNYLLKQHVSYHGYISKLRNVGQNILDRNDWPKCKLQPNCKIPVLAEGYTCLWEYCSLNFCTLYDFIAHMAVHVHNNPTIAKDPKDVIMCCWQACNKKFPAKFRLSEHVRIHTKERIIACPTCCTLFSCKTKLCDHRKSQLATNLQSYQCSQCLKLFPSERLLRDHMRSHINHYKCTMCDMTCPKPSVLAKHMRFKHIKDKPFKCHYCEQKFVAKHNLMVHLKTHTAEKSVKCDLCDFKCRSQDVLDTHYAKAHEKSKSIYECHNCKKKFGRGGRLTKHLMKVHNYHWPSGHTRFRYRRDQDGVHRLQTVRYESLEVTQEMIRSECMQANSQVAVMDYNLKYDNVDGKANYVLSVSENGEPSIKETEQKKESNILITINDVDEEGNIVKSEVVESGGIVKDQIKVEDRCVIKVGDKGGDNQQQRRVTRSMKREKKGIGRSLPVISESDIRYFPEDIILNYNKFEIKVPVN